MRRAVIIVAGGKGLRMGSELPKQFLSIAGVPILCRTVLKFMQYDPEISIYLALPKSHFAVWQQLSAPYIPAGRCTLVEGGPERFFSVKNALDTIPDDIDVVGVHDGVRPLVTTKVIASAYTEATLNGNAVPCIAPPESIRYADSEGNHMLNRDCVKLIQTPQVFHLDILKAAYQLPYTKAFTDDASVVETSGKKINLIEGDKQNIKITTFEDLNYAEFLLKKSE